MAIKKIYPFSEVHKKTIIDFQTNKINILLGAVRSGKSYLADILSLKYLKNKKGKCIWSGCTSDTIKKNSISNLEKYLDCKIIFKNNSFGQYFIIDKDGFRDLIFYVVGGGKAGDEKKVQGMEVLFWYADEVATYHKDFFNMMLTRLSQEDSKAILTLNPEGPSHWLKQWIDNNTNKDLDNYIEGYIATNTFTLLDNYSLPKQYVKQIQNSLSGHMYQRLVLGKWSAGEGLIYSVDKINYINKEDEIINNILKNKNNYKFTIGIDLGTTHPSAFVFIAKDLKTKKYYILEEYYKSKVAPSDLSKDLIKFYNDCKNKYQIFSNIEVKYDYAAAWFFQEFQKTTNHNIILSKAKKNVLEGIMYIEKLILNNELFIDKSCTNVKNEFLSYSWDTKKDNEVIKEKDDILDAIRYAIYSNEYQSSSY